MRKANNGAITTKAQAGELILGSIEREFEKQAPGFNRLPVAVRAKHIKHVLSDAMAEIEKEKNSKFDALHKIAGLSPTEGELEAIGFDDNRNLVHLRGLAIRKISIKDSVRMFRKIEERWISLDGNADWHQDDDCRLRWFRMVEKALKN